MNSTQMGSLESSNPCKSKAAWCLPVACGDGVRGDNWRASCSLGIVFEFYKMKGSRHLFHNHANTLLILHT